MLSTAGSPPDDLELQTGFTEWDIQTYIQRVLSAFVRESSKLDSLADRAGVSLQWAVAACQFILSEPGGTVTDRLSQMLDCYGDVGEVYERILVHKLERMDLGIFKRKRDELAYIVQAAPKSWSQSADPHRVIASHCFQVMNRALCFNICDIQSSFLPNYKVEGLQDRIVNRISPTLLYSCTNWAFHLSHSISHPDLAATALAFLHAHTLHWLEVMSLTKTSADTSLEELSFVKVNKIPMFSSSVCVLTCSLCLLVKV